MLSTDIELVYYTTTIYTVQQRSAVAHLHSQHSHSTMISLSTVLSPLELAQCHDSSGGLATNWPSTVVCCCFVVSYDTVIILPSHGCFHCSWTSRSPLTTASYGLDYNCQLDQYPSLPRLLAWHCFHRPPTAPTAAFVYRHFWQDYTPPDDTPAATVLELWLRTSALPPTAPSSAHVHAWTPPSSSPPSTAIHSTISDSAATNRVHSIYRVPADVHKDTDPL